MARRMGRRFHVRQPIRRKFEERDPFKEAAMGGGDMGTVRQEAGLPPVPAVPPPKRQEGVLGRAKALVGKVKDSLE